MKIQLCSLLGRLSLKEGEAGRAPQEQQRGFLSDQTHLQWLGPGPGLAEGSQGGPLSS